MKAAAAATGDDTIIAGGAATDEAWGSGLGATSGVLIGRASVGTTTGMPQRMCIAVSPDEVYLLKMRPLGYHVEPLAKIDRDKLGVEVHNRIAVRTVILEDLDTGTKFPLEVKRLSSHHAKAMVELLMLSDQHHEEEVEEEEPEGTPDEG